MRNMKTMIRVSVIAFAMIFTAGFLGVYGTMSISAADKAYAANDGYTYTVTVYSGKEGYFDGDENKHSKKLTGEAKYGQPLTIEMDDLDLTIIDPDKYYPRGVKPAGHDNDEVSDMTYQSYTFTVTKDEAFTVAYGMDGGMVKYTVRYVDKNGNKLISAKEGQLYVNLWEANRLQLVEAGLLAEHIEMADTCTDCQHQWFYSYRADGGQTGRMAAIIALNQY